MAISFTGKNVDVALYPFQITVTRVVQFTHVRSEGCFHRSLGQRSPGAGVDEPDGYSLEQAGHQAARMD